MDNNLVEIYLTEYKLLKEEQRSRITVRDNLIYATFTALAGVVFFAFGREVSHPVALLLLPPVCLVFGWIYLANDTKISDIGRYLRTELSSKLVSNSTLFHTAPGTPEDMKFIEFHLGTTEDFIPVPKRDVLGWEFFHIDCGLRRRSKLFQLIVDLFVFIVVGLAAVATYGFLTPHTPWIFICISGVEVFSLSVFACEFIIRSDFFRFFAIFVCSFSFSRSGVGCTCCDSLVIGWVV